MWQKLEKIFQRAELKGFNWANNAHKTAINVFLLVVAYSSYAFLRDYNNFFLQAREIKHDNDDGPINSSLK